MKHYDGPAFYRNTNNKINNSTSGSLTNITEHKKLDEKKMAKIFQPTYIPPSTSPQLKKVDLRKKYLKLKEELTKHPDSYLLFGELSEEKLPLVDLTERVVFVEGYADNSDFEKDISDEVELTDEDMVAKEDLEVNFETSLVAQVIDDAQIVENLPLTNKQSEKVILQTETFYPKKQTSLSKKIELPTKIQQDSPQVSVTKEIKQVNVAPVAKKPQTSIVQQVKIMPDIQGYQLPTLSLLPAPVYDPDPALDEWILNQSEILNETLAAFNVEASVKDWTIGPTVTQFEITLERGVKVNKITNLTDDLKLALAAKDIRIEAPIPGKSSIGIEIPNQISRPVMLSEVLSSSKFKEASSPLTIALGVDLFGQPQITDLKKMPHGLIAGATGSGKSVFLNSLLVSLLYKATPAEVKLLLIDPKAVELAPYHDIGHLLAPVISDPKAASAALKWVVDEMEQRYQRLAAGGARNIESFNAKAKEHQEYGLQMPYIVVVIDELADLMMVAASEVQDYIARITAKARAAGIHLIIATQRPSVDVITGTIKNNIPTRIAFMVASQVDSRTILDVAGAERLLGRGDMLYLGNGSSQPLRLQGTYIDDEVDVITDFVRQQTKPCYAFDPDGLKQQELASENEDELLPRVLDYLVNEENISTSKLQRVFSIGYNRAAGIIDDLEQRGFISSARGSKPREVYLTAEQLENLRNQ